MKEIRPFQIILLAGFGIAALLGVFAFANFSGGGNEAKVGEVTIWGTLPEEAVAAGIQELAAANDEFADVAYVEKSPASFDRALSDAISEGRGPDLVILTQEDLLTEKGKLVPIPYTSFPERAFVDSYVPEFELFLDPSGVYGVPLVVDPLVLYYNRTILSSEAIATAPRTWEAVAGLASSVVERTAAGDITRSLVPFGGYANVANARAVLSLLLLQSGSKISTETSQGVRASLSEENSTGGVAAESAVSYYAQFADSAKTVYSWNQALPYSRASFLAGDLALYPGFASERAMLAAAAPNLDFEMAVIPQPGVASARMTYGLAYVASLAKGSDNAQGAYRAAVALAGPKAMQAIARAHGSAPASRSLLSAPADDRYAALYYPEALVARGWLSPAPSATDGIFSAMIGNMTSGRQAAPKALNSAAEALNAALR